MKFRTQIEIPPSRSPIDYSNKILSMGSCFATSIGGKLRDSKFSICVNPAGVLFNPASIASALHRFQRREYVEISDLRCSGGQWFHFDFHGSLSAPTAQQAQQKINQAIDRGCEALQSCDTIILTLGSAWVYYLQESGAVVANCHKQPARLFERRAMRVEQIVESLSEIIKLYPEKHFIFSVSPIRHLADGLPENALSKSMLRVAVAEIESLYENVSYFPAYEIMMDDLRDYRYYGDDMVHPSNMAMEYIWEKFRLSRISAAAYPTMEKVEKIIAAAAHRPLNEGSAQHVEFCRKQLQAIKELQNLDFGKESAYFMSQLQNNL